MTRRVEHQRAPGGFVGQTRRVLGQVHPLGPPGRAACWPAGLRAIGVGV